MIFDYGRRRSSVPQKREARSLIDLVVLCSISIRAQCCTDVFKPKRDEWWYVIDVTAVAKRRTLKLSAAQDLYALNTHLPMGDNSSPVH